MKKTLIKSSLAAAALLANLILHPTSLRAQGSLTPPGAPAPTMKTLTQIEPRTPVDATNTPGTATVQYVINQPGSYYLTGNILVAANRTGITIQTNDVTLDLNGFVMTGHGGNNDSAIAVVGQVAQNNVVIRNGTLRNWTDGVFAPGGYCELEHVRVYGSAYYGFYLGDQCTVRNCTVAGNGTAGITIGNGGVIADCLVSSNLYDGIYGVSDCLVSGCQAYNNGEAGIDLGDSFNVSGCTANGNDVYGFILGSAGQVNKCTANANNLGGFVGNTNCLIKDCVAISNNGLGIYFSSNCQVINNLASGNAIHGILLAGSGNRIENNHCDNNQSFGILSSVGPGADIIVRNSCSSNLLGNYKPTNGPTFAPIQTPATATSPWANF